MGDGADDDRSAILKRRKRFIAIALSGIATTATATGCYDAHEREPGLMDASGADASDPDTSVSPMPCLEAPMPCLSAPMPCLGALPEDAGSQDAAPQPCLDFAPVDAGEEEA